MKQTKLISIIEVCLNVGSGFILAMLVWGYVIPEAFPRMAGPLTENFVVTSIFTIVSVIRGYFWRRFFNNGVYVTVMQWIRRVTGGRFGKLGGGDGNLSEGD